MGGLCAAAPRRPSQSSIHDIKSYSFGSCTSGGRASLALWNVVCEHRGKESFIARMDNVLVGSSEACVPIGLGGEESSDDDNNNNNFTRFLFLESCDDVSPASQRSSSMWAATVAVTLASWWWVGGINI